MKYLIVSCRGPDYSLLFLLRSLSLNSTICLAWGPPLGGGQKTWVDHAHFTQTNTLSHTFSSVTFSRNIYSYTLNMSYVFFVSLFY